MDSKTFTEWMERTSDHTGKKLKDVREYWEALERIPDDAFEEIMRNRIRAMVPTPGHFPTIQAILDDYAEWLKRHPHRKEIVRWEFCAFCESDTPGLIEVKMPLKESMYRNPNNNFRNTVVRCAHCNNGKHRNPTIPLYRREEMEAKDWQTVTPIRQREKEVDISVPTVSEKPRGGISHIEVSLPIGDRDD